MPCDHHLQDGKALVVSTKDENMDGHQCLALYMPRSGIVDGLNSDYFWDVAPSSLNMREVYTYNYEALQVTVKLQEMPVTSTVKISAT